MTPEIIALQKRLDAARLAQARAVAAQEQANQSWASNLEALKAEFDLDSLEGARAKLDELRNEVQSNLDKAVENLNRLE